LSPEKIAVAVSFVVLLLALISSVRLLKFPTGDPAAVYFPVLSKLIDGQGLEESFLPLKNGFMRTPALDIMAYLIHVFLGTDVLTTVRIFLVISNFALLAAFFGIMARLFGTPAGLLSVWLVFSIPNFLWLTTQFLTDVPALVFMLLALGGILFSPLRRWRSWIAISGAALWAVYIRPPVYLFLVGAMIPLGMLLRPRRLPWKKILIFALVFYALLGILDHFAAPNEAKQSALEQGAWNRSFKSIELERGLLKNAILRRPGQFVRELAVACFYRLPLQIAEESFRSRAVIFPILIGLLFLVFLKPRSRPAFALLGLFLVNLPMAAVVYYEPRYTIFLYFVFSGLLAVFVVRLIDILFVRRSRIPILSPTALALGLLVLPLGMSFKTYFELHSYQEKINREMIPAETLFQIMRSRNLPKPLDDVFGDLARTYFRSPRWPTRPLRYFAHYRYYAYFDLNYVSNQSPYSGDLIQQDNALPNLQEPEDMLLAAGYRYWLPEFPILDPAKIPENYRLVFLKGSDYLIQNIAQRVPYPRKMLSPRISCQGADVTERLADRNSETTVKSKNPVFVVAFEMKDHPNELVILPKMNKAFASDILVSVLDEEGKERIVQKTALPASARAEDPLSFFLDPAPGRQLTISLKSRISEDIEVGEIMLFRNEYDDVGKFYEVRGKIVNRSFSDVSEGIPAGWAFDSFPEWGRPLIVKNAMDPGVHWLKFENKGTLPLNTFQQVALEEGFYAVFFLAYTSGKPSSYAQVEYLPRGETTWRYSTYERLTRPGRGLYFKTFFLEKPSLVRFNFHQYIPAFHFPRRKGVTYLTEVRLFKFAKEKEGVPLMDPRIPRIGR
jgi:hypothetical protein